MRQIVKLLTGGPVESQFDKPVLESQLPQKMSDLKNNSFRWKLLMRSFIWHPVLGYQTKVTSGDFLPQILRQTVKSTLHTVTMSPPWIPPSKFKLGLIGVNHKFRGLRKNPDFLVSRSAGSGGCPRYLLDFKTNPRPIHVGTPISQILIPKPLHTKFGRGVDVNRCIPGFKPLPVL